MGVTLCTRHGKTGIELVCEHLAEDVQQNRALPERVQYPITLDGDEFNRFTSCRPCVERFGLPTSAQPLDFARWEDNDHPLPSIPVCALCYREAAG